MTTPQASALARPVRIGAKTAPNRIVYQPMEANDADECGRPTQRTIDRYRRFAEGGPGVIFLEAISIWPESRGRVRQLQLNADTADALADLVAQMRDVNPEPLLLFQITHDGRQSGNFSRRVSAYPTDDPALEVLTAEEIEAIGDGFARGAALARSIGADGIDFKHCHGYLCCEMLRPANQRDDAYGGSFENRTRFSRETLEKIKAGVDDPSFILGSRVSVYEPEAGGFGAGGEKGERADLAEPLAFVRLMEEAGMHYVDVTAGRPLTVPVRNDADAVRRHFQLTEAVKKATDMVVMGSAYTFLRDGDNALAGSDSREESFACRAAKNVADGVVDMVGVGRQSFADPLFAKKILSGDGKINFCTLCNQCRDLLGRQEESGCVVYDPYYRALLKKDSSAGTGS